MCHQGVLRNSFYYSFTRLEIEYLAFSHFAYRPSCWKNSTSFFVYSLFLYIFFIILSLATLYNMFSSLVCIFKKCCKLSQTSCWIHECTQECDLIFTKSTSQSIQTGQSYKFIKGTLCMWFLKYPILTLSYLLEFFSLFYSLFINTNRLFSLCLSSFLLYIFLYYILSCYII